MFYLEELNVGTKNFKIKNFRFVVRNEIENRM